jgi:hypothetical protein
MATDPAFPVSDDAVITSSIIARFATTQPDPLTQVIIRFQPITANPMGGPGDRTVFFSIVTFDP